MIHYHGIDGADAKFISTVFSGRHCFCSFAMQANLPHVVDVCSTFALDNGAFTAWRKGLEYDFGGYVEWVHEWSRHPAYDWHVIPDKIDGCEKENRKIIEGWSIKKGVPVWHMHESVGYLKDLCESFSKVAIGASGEYSAIGGGKWWQRVATAMETVCVDGSPICSLHGLRMLKIAVFSKLPLHSADSTFVVRDSKYDANFKGYNAPKSKHVRGYVLADRIESHQSARKFKSIPKQLGLF